MTDDFVGSIGRVIKEELGISDTQVRRVTSRLRAEYRGDRGYIAGEDPLERAERAARAVVMALSGARKTEVAHAMGISRRTVYRLLERQSAK